MTAAGAARSPGCTRIVSKKARDAIMPASKPHGGPSSRRITTFDATITSGLEGHCNAGCLRQSPHHGRRTLSDATTSPNADGPREAPAHLAYYDAPPTPAVATIVSYGKRRRIVRAVVGGLTCWVLAAVSVFVPLGHFFMVPGFLIAGPIVFLMRIAEGVSLRGARGTCPVCRQEQTFTERGRIAEPLAVRCSACGRELTLALDPAPTVAEIAGEGTQISINRSDPSGA